MRARCPAVTANPACRWLRRWSWISCIQTSKGSRELLTTGSLACSLGAVIYLQTRPYVSLPHLTYHVTNSDWLSSCCPVWWCHDVLRIGRARKTSPRTRHWDAVYLGIINPLHSFIWNRPCLLQSSASVSEFGFHLPDILEKTLGLS
jgi:hypothetical protein